MSEEIPPDVAAIIAKSNGGAELSEGESKRLAEYEAESKRPEYADSMEAAASMVGLPLSILKLAKKKGCTAFRGSRVYLEDLEKFIDVTDLDLEGVSESEKLDLDIKREQLRKRRFDNEVSEGQYLKRDELRMTLRALSEVQSRILRTALEKRFPEIAERKTKRELRELGANLYDEICGEFQSAVKKLC